jgi:hypothetical protein
VRSTLVCLFAFAAISVANPVVEYFLGEIQVAPDSQERIELHMYSNERPYPVDLSGWTITTNAGVATIDSGIELQDSTDFLVISRENVSGPFGLGDDSDNVYLEEGAGLRDQYSYGTYGWTPPSDMAVAVYTHWEGTWPDEYLVGDWYLDSTPTFGEPNDDRYGGIAGRVLDRYGWPLPWCSVSFRNAGGNAYAYCDKATGRYILSPLGPGTYEVSAHADSTYLPAYYPESVSIGVNGWRDSINMTMYPAGVAQESQPTSHCFLLQHGRSLVIAADRPGTALLTVYDNLGRVRMSEKVTLASGSNGLALTCLRSGVYFASCRLGERTLKTKIVLY